MTPTAVILLIVSAFTHSGWNIIGKRSESTATSFLVSSFAGILILAPALFLFPHIVASITLPVWGYLAAAGLFQAIYYGSLAAAYRSGEMSIVYPFARSTPAILVALFALVVGRADVLSARAIAGILLVASGGYLLPLKSIRNRSSQSRFDHSLVFAFTAAVGTAGYSIVDSHALELLRGASGEASWQVSLVYACFEAISSAFWLGLYVTIRRKERGYLIERFAAAPAGLMGTITMGAGIYLTYSLVLVSMAFVDDVSYVVAFRQLSIPLGVVLSRIFLREPIYGPKAAGASLMLVGVILVGIG